MSQSWIGALVAGVGLLVGLAVQGGAFAFLLGRHAQRLATVERDSAELKAKSDEHAGAIAALTGMRQLLEEVRQDVKYLLTGRPGREERR